MIGFPLILASASPRRLHLLKQIGLSPIVRKADIDEAVLNGETPAEHAIRLARAKGRKIVMEEGDDPAVIAADTIVVLDRCILGKPRDAEEAADFLQRLSGREHQVVTALSLFWKGREISRLETTRVRFSALSESMIRAYLDTGDFRDKAGAYGIQSFAAVFVPSIDGCFFNVVGFPLHLFIRMAEEIGLPVF